MMPLVPDVATLVESSSTHLAAGRVDEAENDAREALQMAPESAEALNALGNALVRRGEADEAEVAYRAAVERAPASHKPYHNLGNILRGKGKLEEAALMYRSAIERRPDAHRSFGALAFVEAQLGRRAEAESAYRSALEGAPTKELWHGLGTVLALSKRFDESVAALTKAKALGATGTAFELSLAETAVEAGATDVAVSAVLAARASMRIEPTGKSRALALRLAHLNLALHRATEAVEVLEMAVLPSALPGSVLTREALDVLWRSKLAAGDIEGAWSAFARALVEGHTWNAFLRASLFFDSASESDPEARLLEVLRRVEREHPEQPNLSAVLASQLIRDGLVCEAQQVLTRARERHPKVVELVTALSEARLYQGAQEDAITLQREAVELAPENAEIHAALLFRLHYADTTSREEIFAEHVLWGERHGAVTPLPRLPIEPHAKTRVGFLSSDFARHSVCRFMLPFFQRHDRARFELYAYMSGIAHDEYTDLVITNVHRFRDVSADDSVALAERVRADGIDILIDLSGHTGVSRLTAMARRPAPIQATYLGYPDTTGLPAIDYRVTDSLADPKGAEAFAVEELVRLPKTAWCFAPGSLPAARPRPPAGPVVFASFNNVAKITPRVVASWARIVASVDHSKLVLKWITFREAASRALWTERFLAAGLPSSKLELLEFTEHDGDHVALYGGVDIALDTFPYNGTTTTCEALSMGVPVITLVGDRHAGRVGASLLSSVGLSELVAHDVDDYEKLAMDLARDHVRRSRMRRSLELGFPDSPLADSHHFARAFEAMLESMKKT